MTAAAEPILSIEGVDRLFVQRPDAVERFVGKLTGHPPRDVVVRAVDDVSLEVNKGEIVGIVGESGCGKSTLGKMVAGVLTPTSGRIKYLDHDIYRDSSVAERLKVQMVFQDPYASLNPRMTVGSTIGEAAVYHHIVSSENLGDFVSQTLERVGLNPSVRSRYPHQFSGGQRQRIGVARALAVKPDLLVCDEAVSALDVSVQAQIINMFMELRDEFNLTYLFISHDLSVINYVSDRVVVMYLGRVVESGPATELMSAPNHPYTQALMDDVPISGQTGRTFHPIKGEIPSPLNPPSGCHFHPRCKFASERCRVERPVLKEISPGRLSACHLNDEQ